MKKVKFDNSQSIAFRMTLPGLAPMLVQLKPMKLEGWLVDEHVCVQKPAGKNGGWCVSLYLWGDMISLDFVCKDDATEYAQDVSKMEIDWKTIYRPENYGTGDLYSRAIKALNALAGVYRAAGYFKPQ
jgi:hypothetical protein